jgi:uncharacterized membrane protein
MGKAWARRANQGKGYVWAPNVGPMRVISGVSMGYQEMGFMWTAYLGPIWVISGLCMGYQEMGFL